MDVGLPKETQQIDRVMEAFAAQYQECNPSLFLSSGEKRIVENYFNCTNEIPLLSRPPVHSSV